MTGIGTFATVTRPALVRILGRYPAPAGAMEAPLTDPQSWLRARNRRTRIPQAVCEKANLLPLPRPGDGEQCQRHYVKTNFCSEKGPSVNTRSLTDLKRHWY